MGAQCPHFFGELKMGNPVFSIVPADMPLVISACLFAEEQHRGQLRKFTNEPYVTHPMRVARMVGQFTMDPHVVAAALLHDVLEDTDTTSNEILMHFGIRVQAMVEALTDSPLEVGNRKTRKAIDHQRLRDAGSDVHLIKICDMVDNWRSISIHDPNFAILFRREAIEFVNSLTDLDPHLLLMFKSTFRKVRL